jgi:hypothetical protein
MRRSFSQIKDLIQALKKSNSYFAQIEDKHLSEQDLSAFEKLHQIKLPHNYHEFLLMFGEEVILPVVNQSKTLSLNDSVHNGIWKSFSGPLNEPFKYQSQKPIALEWNDQKDDYEDPQPLSGTLCLGSGGCDILWLLIITGKDAGKVWRFSPDSEQALHPTGLDFLDWYKQQLQKKLNQLNKIN